MSIYRKISFFILQMVWLILFALPVSSMNVDDAPVSVTIDYLVKLYEAVSFDHQTHSEMYNCSSCHHHTAGTGTQNETCKKCHAVSGASGDVSCSGCHKEKTSTLDTSIYHIDKHNLTGALHLQCVGCHRSENGPTGCQECHAFTPAGKKRFALRK